MTPRERNVYDEARRRIEECRREGKRGTVLNLTKLGLSVLPPGIGQLTALKKLLLLGNQLSALPPEIYQLTELTELYLHDNLLRALPPEIGRLTALTELYLHDNQLQALPPEIGRLTALTGLYLYRNHLTALPPEIGQLTALTKLYLLGNQLCALPPQIGQLTSLTELYLDGNQLSTLPPQIGQLTALRHLSLHSNRLTALPPEIGQLTNLKSLDLRKNPKLGLPAEVHAPTLFERATKKKSDSTLGAPSRILAYYFRTHPIDKVSSGKALLEVRIIVIGDGAAGKTSLARQLMRDAPAREQEASTRDVMIEQWPSRLKGKTVVAHLWDFGGQKQMHAAHPYFFTTRTLYLVVAEARRDQQDRVDYWLKMVAKYGGSARALVVINKVEPEGHAMALDRPKLLDRYRLNLPEDMSRAFFSTSCTQGTGIDKLRTAIRQEMEEMDQVWALWPAEWFKVKQTVQEMRDPKTGCPRSLKKLLSFLPTSRLAAPHGAETILYDEWRTICNECGVIAQEEHDELLEMMAHLGKVVCFPRDANLRQLGALNPEWVTRGIYPLLVDPRVAINGGILRIEDLQTLLDPKRYPVEKHQWLVELMKAFELIFQDHLGRLLIAAQLPTDSPDWAQPSKWSDEDTLHLELRYDTVLPESVMSQFIVRRHADARQPGEWWRNGIALKRGVCEALVRAHTTEQEAKIELRLRGPRNERRELLSSIRETLRDPRDAMPPVLHVILGKDCAPRYDELLIHAQQNRDLPFIINGQSVRRKLAPILDLIEAPTQQAASREAIVINNRIENTMKQEDHNLNIENSKFIASQVGGHSNQQEITESQVGETLTNCTTMIQQQAPGERKDLLEELARQVWQLISQLPEENKAEIPEIEENLEMVIKQATSEKPNRKWYQVSSEGLLEATKYVKDFTGNIAGTLGSLGKLVLGGD